MNIRIFSKNLRKRSTVDDAPKAMEKWTEVTLQTLTLKLKRRRRGSGQSSGSPGAEYESFGELEGVFGQWPVGKCYGHDEIHSEKKKQIEVSVKKIWAPNPTRKKHDVLAFSNNNYIMIYVFFLMIYVFFFFAEYDICLYIYTCMRN